MNISKEHQAKKKTRCSISYVELRT